MTRRSADVASALDGVVDGLRTGMSLRQSALRIAGTNGSPFAPLADALAAGRPLADMLREAAARCADAHLRSALCVLSAHADAGGDPVPAVSALATRLRRQQAARREARALTTQARLGSRAMLLLTPGFWVLLALSDPHGTRESLHDPRVRGGVAAGVLLQALGALWIGAIVRRSSGEGTITSVPFIRAVWALIAGRQRPATPMEVAETAETLAFVLDAGMGPSSALEIVAPGAPGVFGDGLRIAVARIRAGARLAVAVRDATAELDGSADRFADAFDASVSLGVALAPRLRSLADGIRETTMHDQSEDVRRASVRVLVPLGLLILPAFVLSCLVPLLAGGLAGIAGS